MIHHEARGSGATVLLLHSGGMSGRQWRRLAELLSSDHRVLVPDFLGSGANAPWPPDAPFDFRDDVRAVEALLDPTDVPHVVGHSYGGLIACTLALRRPVRTLTAFDPPAFGVLRDPDDHIGLADLAFVADDLLVLDETSGGDPAWLELFVDYWNGRGAWSAMPAPAKESFSRVGRKVFYEVRSLLADRTPARAYSGVTAPTLLLTGEASPVAARQVVQLLTAAIPHASVTTIEGAGHMAPVTHAGVVNALIRDFVTLVEADDGAAVPGRPPQAES